MYRKYHCIIKKTHIITGKSSICNTIYDKISDNYVLQINKCWKCAAIISLLRKSYVSFFAQIKIWFVYERMAFDEWILKSHNSSVLGVSLGENEQLLKDEDRTRG